VPEAQGIGLGDWLRGLFSGPGMVDQMQASSQRFRDVAGTQGLAAAMRDPEHERLATGVAGGFDFTGGIGLGGMAGVIRAYHGSPHTFDKFDMSKLGTGEGAQAYGHGLYFAENPEVAKSYITANASGGRPVATFDGVPLTELKDKPAALEWLDSYGDVATTRAALKGRKDHVLKELDELIASGRLQEPGSHYTVDLDVNHEDLLDWDAPLSQQPEKVRKALEGLGIKPPPAPVIHEAGRSLIAVMPDGSGRVGKLDANGEVSVLSSDGMSSTGYPSRADWEKSLQSYQDSRAGESAYQALGGPEKAAAALRAAGVPGIRYLDGGSRTDGEGTRNFVMFDDQLAKIVERNGIGLGR
jgi:hypothetical protein